MFYGLSARLLALTVVFVVVVDAAIVVSAAARFRHDWIGDRLWDAQIAVLAVAAAPEGVVKPDLEREALAVAMIENAVFERADGRRLALGPSLQGPFGASYDLRTPSRLALVRDSLDTLINGSKGLVQVTGQARGAAGHVAVVVDEAPLSTALAAHVRRLLLVSLLLSIGVAAIVYAALRLLLIRPLQGLAAHLAEFSEAPEDVRRVIPESDRRDEIGALQRSVRAMEEHVRLALAQKQGLATLGEAVAKVNHDLRNILATARLVSNRLSENSDPGVRTISVTLMRAIDRAIELCSDTLKFGQPQKLRPRVIRFALRPLAEEVGRSVGLSEESSPMFLNHVGPHMEIDGDPEHLFRALQNLVRNSVEAIGDGFGEIAVRCYDMGSHSVIEVSDNGPGLPDHARENLFKAFKGTTHEHGAGLGLVNVREITQAHGGEVRLVKSDGAGTIFRLHLPLNSDDTLRQAAG
ncbi:MAG: sensor histidine kinase [Sphingomonadales bacterium]